MRSMDDLARFSSASAKSRYFKDATTAEQAMVKIAYGAELGLQPVASLTGVHIVEGRPCLAANTIAHLIRSSGSYDYKVDRLDNDGCKLTFTRNGEVCGESEFTRDDAERAGVYNRKMSPWVTYPRNMMFARALTNGARWYCPDVFHGSVYTADEIETGDVYVEQTAAIVEEHVTEAEQLPAPQGITGDTMDAILNGAEALGLTDEQLQAGIRRETNGGTDVLEEMTEPEAMALLGKLADALVKKQQAKKVPTESPQEPTPEEVALDTLIDKLSCRWPLNDRDMPKHAKARRMLAEAKTFDDVGAALGALPEDEPFFDDARALFDECMGGGQQ